MWKIEPFVEGNIDELMSWIPSHWELVMWSGHYFGYPLDKTHFESHYDFVMSDLAKRKMFLVRNKETNQPIAYFEYDNIHEINETAFISRFMVRPDHRNQGIGLSVLDAICEYGYTELNLHRLEAIAFDCNENALKLFTKYGFKYEGCYRDFFKNGDKYWDCFQYGLLIEEWQGIVKRRN